jgi:glycine oxidase
MSNTSNFDFVVIGNGAIGLLTAIKLKENFPRLSIAIVGPVDRKGSASAAAGAMANVFAEYESAIDSDYTTQDLYLKIGIAGRNKWKEFLLTHKMEKVITATSTLVYLQKKASHFELLNFSKVVEVSEIYNCLRKLSSDQMRAAFPATSKALESVVEIEGEYAICTTQLFVSLTSYAKALGVEIVEDTAMTLESEQQVMLSLGNSITFKKLIVAAGAQSGNVLRDYHLLPMLQGVGTAIIFDSKSTVNLDTYKRNVIRTVNRGGAQCGIHLVPKSDGSLYLGAGNYVATPGDSPHRIETLRYLFEKVESDILGKDSAYDLTGSVIKGYRPRALDGFPMIGPVKENNSIFVATATNRVGLTWAPEIADQIVAWAKGTAVTIDFADWAPDRQVMSFGSPAKAKEYFVNSRVGAALEHGLIGAQPIDLVNRKAELEGISGSLHIQSAKLVGLDPLKESVNPDNWNVIISNKISCVN